MDAPVAIGLVIIVLQAAILAWLWLGRKSAGTGRVEDLLKRHSDEQRDAVQRQIAAGATEQFQRFGLIQDSVQSTLQAGRAEASGQLQAFQQANAAQLSYMQRATAESLDKINATLEARMKAIQEGNEKRLEQMRGVVEEKLQKTLDTRLAQSFERVGRQLDGVQRGLGEMQNLAADAKSLRNALTNVKERGTYGEVRLEKLLEDILAPGQYEVNAEIADNKRVEFAVKLPGSGDAPLLLPIDSKFPIEDYNRLLEAEDKAAIDAARAALALGIRRSAKDIQDKYIVPPKTTDFAIMFLPTEGLYAEVVRNPALFEELRDKYRVMAVGASTLSAFLASLQIGFKTLAIEQRSREVWKTLQDVKFEFNKYCEVLGKAHAQLQTADKTLDTLIATRTRAMQRRLRNIEGAEESGGALPPGPPPEGDGDE